MTTKTEQIRALNDRLRQNFSEGTAVMTSGVAALGAGPPATDFLLHLLTAAFGPKQTSRRRGGMSAFGGKADIASAFMSTRLS
jgi:hypothetical protein